MTNEYKHITYTQRHMEEALYRSDEFHYIQHEKMREVARKLQEENARLRKALERISKSSLPHEEPVSREIARAALEGKE